MDSVKQPFRWLLAAAGVVVHVWAPTLVAREDLARAADVPAALPLVVPPLLYGLVLASLPRVSFAGRLAGTVALYLVHDLLSRLTPGIFALMELDPSTLAEGRALWAFPAAAMFQLLSVPFVMLPFRDLLIRLQPRRRGRRESRRGVPIPVPTRSLAAWDDLASHTASGERLADEIRGQMPEWRRPVPHPAPPAVASRERAETPAALPPPEAASLDKLPTPGRPARPERPELFEVNVPSPPAEASAAAASIEPPPRPTPPATAPKAEEVRRPRVIDPGSAQLAAEAERIAALLRPVGPIKVETQVVRGVTLFTAGSEITLFTACWPRLPKNAVARSAFRFLSFLAARPKPGPVTQATLRGSGGAMVLTPLGPLSAGGPVVVSAIPNRGTLALLEILSLRVAAEYRVTAATLSVATDAPAAGPRSPTDLQEAPVPPQVDLLARSLGASGPVAPLVLQDRARQVLLYLLLPPGVDGPQLGQLAWDLYGAMAAEDDPGGIGRIESIVLRLGPQRVVVKPIPEAGGRSALLVSADGGEERPGLAQLELERAAARLRASS